MDIWQSAGRWYINDKGKEQSFNTEQEARQAMAKIETAKAIIKAVQSLAAAADSADALEAEYFDVGNWTDEDVAALGITAQQLAACITLLQQIKLLMSGQPTSSAVYRTTLNRVRRVLT
ncbi:hypothetical protein [Caldilinea sp.]|jgi:hypothetical protein|uniref:hypothetical protein n=1 Tax=Caldilinea sp. TaxID=2293560 RepID=UPI001B05A917|nr:hypothetical protein [Caldilinea sp.]MBO9394363.1 hypothetical protein [Caldilinea sp.]